MSILVSLIGWLKWRFQLMLNCFLKCFSLISCLSKHCASNNYSSLDDQFFFFFPVLTEGELEPNMAEIHLCGKSVVPLLSIPQHQIPHTSETEAHEEDDVNYVKFTLPLYNWVEIYLLVHLFLFVSVYILDSFFY